MGRMDGEGGRGRDAGWNDGGAADVEGHPGLERWWWWKAGRGGRAGGWKEHLQVRGRFELIEPSVGLDRVPSQGRLVHRG